MVFLAVDANEPPGKPMKDYQMNRVVLTLQNRTEDLECHNLFDTKSKRQQQICRMAVEAKDQNSLLTQEDLGELLGTDVRTIRRDIKDLRERGIVVPTRGQQKDIGPGVTHREIAIKMFIEHMLYEHFNSNFSMGHSWTNIFLLTSCWNNNSTFTQIFDISTNSSNISSQKLT